jgi:hypothetical protein
MWEKSIGGGEFDPEGGEPAHAKSINVIPIIMSFFTLILFARKPWAVRKIISRTAP